MHRKTVTITINRPALAGIGLAYREAVREHKRGQLPDADHQAFRHFNKALAHALRGEDCLRLLVGMDDLDTTVEIEEWIILEFAISLSRLHNRTESEPIQRFGEALQFIPEWLDLDTDDISDGLDVSDTSDDLNTTDTKR